MNTKRHWFYITKAIQNARLFLWFEFGRSLFEIRKIKKQPG